MKKLFVLAFLAVSMTAYAGERTDDDNSGGIELSKKNKEKDGDWHMHFAAGVNVVTGAPKGVDFAPFRSWDLNWTIAQYEYTPKGASQTYSVGIGLGWRNYTLSDRDKAFMKDGDVTDIYHVDKVDGRTSRVHIMNANIPVLFRQKLGEGFAVSVGAQININAYGRLVNKWDDNATDNEYDVKTKKIGQRPLTVDVLGMVHFKDWALYCKYSPMDVFKKDRGPEFKSIAFGIYF